MDIGHDPQREQREQLELFHAFSGELPARDAQDLMAYPFFSLAKSKRTVPIDFRTSSVTVRVEGTAEHGLATIWDADILIWAASQIVEARDAGIRSSRLMAATPYEILRFIGRGTSLRDYQRLKAALDRLQSTSIATSIRQPNARRLHRFSWINENDPQRSIGIGVARADAIEATQIASKATRAARVIMQSISASLSEFGVESAARTPKTGVPSSGIS